MSNQNSNSQTILSEQLLREVYNLLPVVVLFIDFEGEILEANSAIEDLTGYQVEEVKGQNIRKLCKNFNPGKIINQTLSDEEIVIAGKQKDVTVSLFNKTSEVEEGVIVVMKDLKKAKEKEKEVEDKVKELKRFNRLATGRELKMVELKREKKKLQEKNEKLTSKNKKLKEEINQLKEKARGTKK